PNTLYPLKNYMPLITNSIPPKNRIAICSLYKSNPNRNYPPYLFSIPEEIQSVPLGKCKYLSLIFLQCSLERTPGANPFSEYRTLVGTMNYSQNLHSLSLYSGLLGAYLNPSSFIQSTLPLWFDNSLINAINWFKENNPYIHQYSQLLPLNLNTTLQFSIAIYSIIDENTPKFQDVNSSIQVQFLTTDPSNIQSKAIILLYMIDSLNDDPYWTDRIEKYFA
ncbi:38233_t:CDS:2, partial [Gigaspora margarita]